MAELELNGISRGALGDVLMDAIDLASDQDQMTWLVSDGKRIAAIVPVEVAEPYWARVDDTLARHFTRKDTGNLR